MPDHSKSQMRWSFWAEKQGKLKPGTAKKWADITPNRKSLPERVIPKKSSTRSKSSRSTPTRKSR